MATGSGAQNVTMRLGEGADMDVQDMTDEECVMADALVGTEGAVGYRHRAVDVVAWLDQHGYALGRKVLRCHKTGDTVDPSDIEHIQGGCTHIALDPLGWE